MKLTIEDAENGWILRYEGLYNYNNLEDVYSGTRIVERNNNIEAKNSVKLLEEISDLLQLHTGHKEDKHVLAILTVPGYSCDYFNADSYDDYDSRLKWFAERFVSTMKRDNR